MWDEILSTALFCSNANLFRILTIATSGTRLENSNTNNSNKNGLIFYIKIVEFLPESTKLQTTRH